MAIDGRRSSAASRLWPRILVLVCLGGLTAAAGRAGAVPSATAEVGIHKIHHVVVILQENRSFDSYFGTYPGADGIPRDAKGQATVCVPDPKNRTCVKPYHDNHDRNFGGPHTAADAVGDVDGGRMDGFVRQVEGTGVCEGGIDPR